MYRDEAHRKVCESLALHGRYINAGEKVDAPEWYAGEVFGAWQASGIDGAGSITPEMREDIVYECFDTIQSCVNLLESIGTTDAELRDSTRKVYANNVERGRYEPY